jgi:hypothetical protein
VQYLDVEREKVLEFVSEVIYDQVEEKNKEMCLSFLEALLFD